MNDFKVEFSIPFATAREADVVYQVLRVDKEPPRSGVSKNIEQKDNLLQISFFSTEIRKLRVGITSFFDSLTLITETIKQFGPPEPVNRMEHTPAPYAPRAVYGYAMYIGFNLLFLLYLIWSVVPDYILKDYLGLSYYPSKYWAIAIPVWALTALATFAFIIYPAINLLMTPDIDDIRTITDNYAQHRKETIPGGVPPVFDIPITEVCRQLYLSKEIKLKRN
ncbi:Phosphatidylinositol N-acetylglucosaminyltransferase subunit P [Vespula maculifrons]|uniref:L antigen family member 3 n=2 Tax=Vespula TaxID=7451 RepID=A0ABD2D2Y5_VESMC